MHNFKNLKKLSQILNIPLTFIDLETTGMVHERQFSIIEIGLIHIDANDVVYKDSLVNPLIKIPQSITDITGITNAMVANQKDFSYFAKYIEKIARNHLLLGFNSKIFDSRGLEKMMQKHQIHTRFDKQIDVRYIYLKGKKTLNGFYDASGTLTQACQDFNVFIEGHAHRAAYDILLTAFLMEELIERFGMGIIHKEIDKIQDKNIKTNYYRFIIQNNIQI